MKLIGVARGGGALTLKGPGGGGGAESAPLNVSRDNFTEFFFRAVSFHDFFL